MTKHPELLNGLRAPPQSNVSQQRWQRSMSARGHQQNSHTLTAQMGLHELVPCIAEGLFRSLVQRGCPASSAAATAARRGSAAHTAAASLGVFLEHAADHHQIVPGAGDAVERLDPAEHIEGFTALAGVPEIKRRGVKVGEHGSGAMTREAQAHLVDHAADSVPREYRQLVVGTLADLRHPDRKSTR